MLFPECGVEQAVPAPTCCRRTEHESGKHKSDFPNSSLSKDCGHVPHKGDERRIGSTASRRQPRLPHASAFSRFTYTSLKAVVSC